MENITINIKYNNNKQKSSDPKSTQVKRSVTKYERVSCALLLMLTCAVENVH